MIEFLKDYGPSVAGAALFALVFTFWVSPGTTEGMIFLFAVAFAVLWIALLGVLAVARILWRRRADAKARPKFRSTRNRPDDAP